MGGWSTAAVGLKISLLQEMELKAIEGTKDSWPVLVITSIRRQKKNTQKKGMELAKKYDNASDYFKGGKCAIKSVLFLKPR